MMGVGGDSLSELAVPACVSEYEESSMDVSGVFTRVSGLSGSELDNHRGADGYLYESKLLSVSDQSNLKYRKNR